MRETDPQKVFEVKRGRERGESRLTRKFQVILATMAMLLFIGTLLNITSNPLLWGTGTVTALFMVLLFTMDPLNPGEK
ncbi:hypothetical protein FTO70_08230 [Methanosarcina sp. KYL-1]|uniref:hypothetical protein n=1 Tax=Methanosarcina sp. KYL-1 TaxID=2602068 RepID=UPI0021010D00|nr:hypothetical protein [Methanosarcina sp. KYL-1]MCQ1535665.1 hypothetical protein [Methanosarcina sp. KYL-1]